MSLIGVSLIATARAHDLALGLVGGLAILFLLSIVAFRFVVTEADRSPWVVATFSVLCLVGIVGLWYLAASAVNQEPEIGTPMVDQTDVDAYLASHPGPWTSTANRAAILIPTGVFVQSVEFGTSNDVDVSGYIWQKYAATVPADVKRGVVLPEALAEAYRMDEAYRFKANNVEVIGWYFHTTLRQPFDYRRYPFDHHDLWLRLWHPDLDRRVLLVPDFASYADMDPTARPGLEEQFVHEGWDPEFAAFSYTINRYNTTFGYGGRTAPDGYPELYFSVGLKREFVRPLVEHILPMAVVLVLLFLALGLTKRDEPGQERRRFDPLPTLAYCSALLFVILLEHTLIRNTIPPEQIAYLESLVFVSYLALLLIALDAVLLAVLPHHKLIAYKDNLLPRLLYWPLVLGLLLAATLVSLYL